MDLSITIELLRTEMIYVGIEKGLTAPETVRISQRLDFLLNILQGETATSSDRPLQPLTS